MSEGSALKGSLDARSVDWRLSEVVLTVSKGAVTDAGQMFGAIFGREPDLFLRKKISTQAIPWTQWAQGRTETWTCDMRLGVGGTTDEVQIVTHEPALDEVMSQVQQVGTAFDRPGGETMIKVQLFASGAEASAFAGQWLALEQSASVVQQSQSWSLVQSGVTLGISFTLARDEGEPTLSFAVDAHSNGAFIPCHDAVQRVLGARNLEDLGCAPRGGVGKS
jgi:hypothetical protein